MDLLRFNSKDKTKLEQAFGIREIVFIEEQKVNRDEEFDEFEFVDVFFC